MGGECACESRTPGPSGRTHDPGEDHNRELIQTEQSLERLRCKSDNGLVDDETLYRSRLAALVARKAELSANTVVPARWEPVGTGKTFRELWDDPDTDRRQVSVMRRFVC